MFVDIFSYSDGDQTFTIAADVTWSSIPVSSSLSFPLLLAFKNIDWLFFVWFAFEMAHHFEVVAS